VARHPSPALRAASRGERRIVRLRLTDGFRPRPSGGAVIISVGGREILALERISCKRPVGHRNAGGSNLDRELGDCASKARACQSQVSLTLDIMRRNDEGSQLRPRHEKRILCGLTMTCEGNER